MNNLSAQSTSRHPDVSGRDTTRPASLPPTRAARPAVRSRGAFLAGRGERGLVRGLVALLFLAVTTVSLITLAPRVIDAPAVVANPAFELVGTASRLPTPPPASRHP
jgi:hypothetical protein